MPVLEYNCYDAMMVLNIKSGKERFLGESTRELEWHCSSVFAVTVVLDTQLNNLDCRFTLL